MFVGLHVLLAAQTNTPELAISEGEAKDFMASAQNVMRHYSVETTQKTLDWIAFAGCAAGIYVPRVVAISVRRRHGPPAAPLGPRRPPMGPPNRPGHPESPQPSPGPAAIMPDAFAQFEEGHNG